GGTQRDFDGDYHTTLVEGIHNPAQSAERYVTIRLPGTLPPIHCAQHPLEHEPHVVIGPLLRQARNSIDGFRRRDVAATEPHVNGYPHGVVSSSCSRASTVVTGGRQLKLRQTYAAGCWSAGIAATSGNVLASAC